MKSKTLATLVKLRQYQLELEQWKLYRKQIEEQKARLEAEEAEKSLTRCYADASRLTNPKESAYANRYLREAHAESEIAQKKLLGKQHDTHQQLLATLDRQQKREMMTRLHQNALGEEHMEFDYQERKFLDDLAQAGFVRQEKEIL